MSKDPLSSNLLFPLLNQKKDLNNISKVK